MLFPYSVISSIITANPQLWVISFMMYPQTLNFISGGCYLKSNHIKHFLHLPQSFQGGGQMRKWRARKTIGCILLPQNKTRGGTPPVDVYIIEVSSTYLKEAELNGQIKITCCTGGSLTGAVKWWHTLNHLEGMFQRRVLGPLPRISSLGGWVRAREFAFLLCPQAMLTLWATGAQGHSLRTQAV